MFQNRFTVVGRILKIEETKEALKLILSEFGPIKLRCAAEIRDARLRSIATQPNGFKIGDTLSLTGRLVYDERTCANICIVCADGVVRIASAAAAPAVGVTPMAAASNVQARPVAPVARPATPAPAVRNGLGISTTVGAASDDDCVEGDDDDAAAFTKPVAPATPRAVALINDPYSDDIPF